MVFRSSAEKGAFLSLSAAAALAFFAMAGFEDSVNMAEKVKDPVRIFPRIMLAGLAITGVIHVLVSICAVALVPAGDLSDPDKGSALTQVVRAGAPNLPFDRMFPFIGMFEVANSALIIRMMASRLIHGLARQGVLPHGLGLVHQARRTPWMAILFTTAPAFGLIWLVVTRPDLPAVSLLGGTTSLLLPCVFTVVNILLIVLRRRPAGQDHFRAGDPGPIRGAWAASTGCANITAIRPGTEAPKTIDQDNIGGHMNRDSLELRTTVSPEGILRLHLEPVSLPEPGPGQLLVRVEAAPINPSDLGLMFGPADITTLARDGNALTARIPDAAMPGAAGRIGRSMPVGNEGAGTVIAAGPDQQHLVGRRVAMLGGAMYATLRLIGVGDCLVLPEGADPEEGAALFINPLTALGFVETMRAGGHKAIVHAPAASNLGQMLVRICGADGIGLVNIVRSPEQVALLRSLGAVHVVDSSAASFRQDLTAAIAATGATLSFDAIAGGETTSIVLNAMEAVALRGMTGHAGYGSSVMKQGYIYGALDTGPTILRRGFGFTWSVGGWLLFNVLQRLDPALVARMRQRIVEEMTTTFASYYTARIALDQALEPDTAAAFLRKATGEKYLITP